MKTFLLICATTMSLGFNTAMAVGANKAHMVFTPEEMTWVDGPEALPGTKMVILEGDPTKAGPFTMRIKAPAQYKIPAHTHPGTEHVTVMQGTFYMGSGSKLDESKGTKLTTGSFVVIPKNAHHFAWMGDEETIIQLHGVGPWGITFLDQNDDPRKSKKK